MMPVKVFFVKGIGIHNEKIVSFEKALKDAGIEKCNLVYVSSVFPQTCKLIDKAEGLGKLKAGQITFCVMAKNETNKPEQLISAAIGLAVPKNRKHHGYFAEYCFSGKETKDIEKHVGFLAESMLFEATGCKLKPNEIFKTSTCQTAKGNSNYFWTTVIAAAVFISKKT